MMLGAIVNHVASLAEGGEIARMIVGRIRAKMGAGQDDAGAEQPLVPQLRAVAGFAAAVPAVAPGVRRRIRPPSIAQMQDFQAMGGGAALTPALSALEANDGGELAPVAVLA